MLFYWHLNRVYRLCPSVVVLNRYGRACEILAGHPQMNYKSPMRQTKLTALLALLNVALLAVVVWQAHLLRQRTEESKIAQPSREDTVSVPQSSSSSPSEIQAPRPLQGANGTNAAAGYSERQLNQSSP